MEKEEVLAREYKEFLRKEEFKNIPVILKPEFCLDENNPILFLG